LKAGAGLKPVVYELPAAMWIAGDAEMKKGIVGDD
jgi:hypothetical protein